MKKIICFILFLGLSCSANAVNDLYLKQGDLQPYYYAQITDKNGPVNLSGSTATAYFSMRDFNNVNATPKINRQSAVVTNPASGLLEYRWNAGDTDTPGTYAAEFYIIPTNGAGYSVPTRDQARVIIVKNLYVTPTPIPTATPSR
jgi:BppU N-terminal domain